MTVLAEDSRTSSRRRRWNSLEAREARLAWLLILPTALIVFGLVIILFLIFEPDGLYARWLKIKRYIKTFPLHPRKQKGERIWRRWR